MIFEVQPKKELVIKALTGIICTLHNNKHHKLLLVKLKLHNIIN